MLHTEATLGVVGVAVFVATTRVVREREPVEARVEAGVA
jgi:hypothetical protein